MPAAQDARERRRRRFEVGNPEPVGVGVDIVQFLHLPAAATLERRAIGVGHAGRRADRGAAVVDTDLVGGALAGEVALDRPALRAEATDRQVGVLTEPLVRAA